MLFNSFEFYLFFPIVTVIYFLLPYKYRWLHLLLASCLFYAAFIPAYLLILFFTIVIDYWAGILIENAAGSRRKWFLVISIISNAGILAIFKYYNFIAGNLNTIFHDIPLLKIILPIGLSFHTFQAMSYTIEVYRGNQKAERHFGIYALYVMFYPQLVAGPIERPQNMLHQFYEKFDFDYDRVISGLRLMMWGLFKKVIIADRLGVAVDAIYDKPHAFNSFGLILGTFLFTFQIFCDFSGYSDIAIGAARVMGFKLMTNFNKPYQARSVSEFWKRWHISLSTWFRDYLYISLGGNRVSIPRWYFNLFIVFLISGLWHGANWTFVIWGALHGFYLVFALVTKNFRTRLSAKLGLNDKPWIDRIITFLLVAFAWIFFRANNIQDALYIIHHIFAGLPLVVSKIIHHQSIFEFYGLEKWELTFSFVLIGFLETVHYFQNKMHISDWFNKRPVYFRFSIYISSIASLIFLSPISDKAFIYFQF
jgi:D-alanyl-lipoteichoic acid acyltransferase DltB (MBOAT superfamily)